MENGSLSGGKMAIGESGLSGSVRQCQKLKLGNELDAILGPINSRADAPSPTKKWGEFVNDTYLPFYRRKWKRLYRDEQTRIGCGFISNRSTRSAASREF